MKIKQSKAKDLLATLTIDVIETDYHEKVEQILKDYRKTAVIPGFRKGKTPMAIINKKYRLPVIVEEVNKLVQDELYQHISNNKVRVLGSPMPLENNDIDWENSTEFKFRYEIGLAPEFDIKITSKDKLDYYNIKADKKLIEHYCTDIAKRNGKMINPKISVEGDLIFCSITQLDLDGKIMKGGISNEATVSMDFIIDKKIKKMFIGVKLRDVIKLNVIQAFKNHTDLAAMLNVKQEKIDNLTCTDFEFIVKNVNRMVPAELNIELFDKVYGSGQVKTIKEFKGRIKKDAEQQLVGESDRMLKNDVVNYFVENIKLVLPDDFLKRWLVKTSEKPITMEMLNKEYDMYSKSLQWQLIENKILENYKIKVTQEDVVNHTKELILMQMKQYGNTERDDKQLSDIANNILKNEEEKKKIYNQILDERTLIVYKENFKLKQKSISYDDFVKLASEKK